MSAPKTGVDPQTGYFVRTTAIATWMTREEFMAVYGFQWAAGRAPAYGMEQLEPGVREEMFSRLGVMLRWAMRHLIHRGMRFSGIEIDPRGEFRPTQPNPVEPRNQLFLEKLSAGRMLNPVLCIREALSLIERQQVDVDKGPLIEVLLQCERDSKDAQEWWNEDRDTAVAVEELMDERMKKLGFAAVGKTTGPVN